MVRWDAGSGDCAVTGISIGDVTIYTAFRWENFPRSSKLFATRVGHPQPWRLLIDGNDDAKTKIKSVVRSLP